MCALFCAIRHAAAQQLKRFAVCMLGHKTCILCIFVFKNSSPPVEFEAAFGECVYVCLGKPFSHIICSGVAPEQCSHKSTSSVVFAGSREYMMFV